MRLNGRSSRARARAVTLSVRGVVQRFPHLLMIGAAAAIMVTGQLQPDAASHMRTAIVDVLAPALQITAAPVQGIEHISTSLHDYLNMGAELSKLREDNAAMAHWRNSALFLKSENDKLKQLLNYKGEPQTGFLSARVLAEPESSLGHNLIILAGASDGVHVNAAVTSDKGLLGRLLEVGTHTARILLLTDINSRVPVWLEKSHDRAILAGSNDGTTNLLYLPADADVSVGDRVVTSGHGGIFPTGVPVGTVSSIKKGGQVTVALFADPGRTDYVKVIDYSGMIILPNDAENDDEDNDSSAPQPPPASPSQMPPAATSSPATSSAVGIKQDSKPSDISADSNEDAGGGDEER